jgi:hypothetical protein
MDGEQGHRAEVEAEVLDKNGALACREAAERAKAVQVTLEAEAARPEPPSGSR